MTTPTIYEIDWPNFKLNTNEHKTMMPYPLKHPFGIGCYYLWLAPQIKKT